MKLNTAEQASASFATGSSSSSYRVGNEESQRSATAGLVADVHTMSEVNSPDFSRYYGARSSSAVLATARMSARKVNPSEVQALFSEHRRLAHSKLFGRLTSREEMRLDYVRWSLDKIEDAISGPELDMLSAEIGLYRQLGEDLKSLKASVDALNVKQRRAR